MMVQLYDPVRFRELLAPADVVDQARVGILLSGMYVLDQATLHNVAGVTVTDVEAQRPFFPNRRATGTLTQTNPAYVRSDLSLESDDLAGPVWVDLCADVDLEVIIELDAGGIEAAVTRVLSNFASLDEFRAQFRFIDLDAFMAQHGVTTVEELRAVSTYLLTEVRLRAQPPFDPGDPANRTTYRLQVAVMVHDQPDIAETLRTAKLLRATSQRGLAFRRADEGLDVSAPLAPMVVIAPDTLGASSPSQTEISDLFAAEDILVVFVPPP